MNINLATANTAQLNNQTCTCLTFTSYVEVFAGSVQMSPSKYPEATAEAHQVVKENEKASDFKGP